MALDVFQALFTLVRFCENQDNCNNCPLKELCAKMPCEW